MQTIVIVTLDCDLLYWLVALLRMRLIELFTFLGMLLACSQHCHPSIKSYNASWVGEALFQKLQAGKPEISASGHKLITECLFYIINL